MMYHYNTLHLPRHFAKAVGDSYLCWWEGTMVQSLGRQLAVSYRTKHPHALWSSNHAPWYLSERVENIFPHKKLHADFFFYFFLKLKKFWSIVNLQCCYFQVYSKLIQLYLLIFSYLFCIYSYIDFFQILFHYRLLQDTEYSFLC